jgi:hypothetical protein
MADLDKLMGDIGKLRANEAGPRSVRENENLPKLPIEEVGARAASTIEATTVEQCQNIDNLIKELENLKGLLMDELKLTKERVNENVAKGVAVHQAVDLLRKSFQPEQGSTTNQRVEAE